ncbi:MAG: hypothetical protein WA209_09570, partial [Candidatus Acidiferrales bacterium]
MKKLLLGFTVVLVVCVAMYVRFRTPPKPIELAYSGNRHTTLWSTSAQVRESIGTLNFGERLEVLQRFEDQVKVRTSTGLEGWIQERDLMTADVWQMVKDLGIAAAEMPVEAVGHTRAIANLHVGPGRDTPRIRQLGKDVHVEMLERKVPAVPSSSNPNTDDAGEVTPGAKKEDWWLVRANTPDEGPLAGWLLGRFVELDVPEPLPDYANAAGMRIVGWFELNHVNDADGVAKPQYLLIGAHGPEGQPCDFTLLRVYTFAVKHDRYETAFLDSDVCGKLPIEITKATAPGGDVAFSFKDITGTGLEDRK